MQICSPGWRRQTRSFLPAVCGPTPQQRCPTAERCTPVSAWNELCAWTPHGKGAVSFQAAVTNYCRLWGFKSKHVFLPVLEVGRLRSGCLHRPTLREGPLSGLQRAILLLHPWVAGKELAVRFLLIWVPISFRRSLSSWPNYPPKAPPPKIITLGFQHMNFERHKHSVHCRHPDRLSAECTIAQPDHMKRIRALSHPKSPEDICLTPALSILMPKSLPKQSTGAECEHLPPTQPRGWQPWWGGMGRPSTVQSTNWQTPGGRHQTSGRWGGREDGSHLAEPRLWGSKAQNTQLLL